jgi:hypothetical protein
MTTAPLSKTRQTLNALAKLVAVILIATAVWQVSKLVPKVPMQPAVHQTA